MMKEADSTHPIHCCFKGHLTPGGSVGPTRRLAREDSRVAYGQKPPGYEISQDSKWVQLFFKKIPYRKMDSSVFMCFLHFVQNLK